MRNFKLLVKALILPLTITISPVWDITEFVNAVPPVVHNGI